MLHERRQTSWTPFLFDSTSKSRFLSISSTTISPPSSVFRFENQGFEEFEWAMLNLLEDSDEMVKAREVCLSWLDIINDNKSLWRRLILQTHYVEDLETVLDLFHIKSEGTLQEVRQSQLPLGPLSPVCFGVEKNFRKMISDFEASLDRHLGRRMGRRGGRNRTSTSALSCPSGPRTAFWINPTLSELDGYSHLYCSDSLSGSRGF